MNHAEALLTLDSGGAYPVFVVVNGSQAQGTALSDSSDLDLLGMAIPPLDHFLGLKSYGSHGTKEIREGDLDAVMYEVRKFLSLLSNQNPNTLFALHTRDCDVLRCEPAGELLLAHRHLFLTKNVATTFMGYATSALKKMGAPNGPTGDMGAKRKANVERFGYDVKDAAQLIRLLRCGEEILLTGKVHFYRGDIDAEELMAIKRGEWSLERVQAEAEGGFARLKAAEEASNLPGHVDADKVNELCLNIMRLSLGV